MKLQFFLSSFFVQSLPISDEEPKTGFSSNRVKFKIENRDTCPEDEMDFCEGDICGEWICPQGTKEHNSCELVFQDKAAAATITEKYRTCSCHAYVGPIQIFTGCKWKRSDIRPENLEIDPESRSFAASGEGPVVLEMEFTTPTPETTTTVSTGLPKEENFMLFDVEEEPEKTSDISAIFSGSFISCLRSLPEKAEILCELKESTRSCDVTCEDQTEHNVCLCDEEGCFWRNSFNRNCKEFSQEPVRHVRPVQIEEPVRKQTETVGEEPVHHRATELSQAVERFREVESDQGQYRKILREDGTYVRGYDLMLGLIEEMYENGLMQKL